MDLEVLDLTSTEIESGELGAIKYLSEITGWDIKKTANFFILALIFVFDPLANALVISTNQAFKIVRKKDETEESVIQTETVEKIVEVPVDRIVEVEVPVDRIVEVEVPVDRIVEVEVPVDRIVEVVKEVPVDRLVEVIREVPVEVEVPVEIPFKYYVNDNGQIFDDQGNKVDEDIFNKKLEEIEKRVLSYKK